MDYKYSFEMCVSYYMLLFEVLKSQCVSTNKNKYEMKVYPELVLLAFYVLISYLNHIFFEY